MEHLYPGLIEPVTEVIESLISLPTRCRKMQKRSAASLFASEETDSPTTDTSAKSRRGKSGHLAKKEAELADYERGLVSRAAQLASDELAFKERVDACRIHRIPTSQIAASPYQPRRSFDELSLFPLSESVRKNGVLQPLTVRRMPEASTASQPMYELICGERRLRAAESVGLDEVPCIVIDGDSRCAELALIENLQREGLDPFEAAAAIASLIDMRAMTQEQIAKSLSVSQSYIANKLRILRLTEPEREMILSYHLSERHARTFLRLKSLESRMAAVKYVAEHRLTVAQTEAYVDQLLSCEHPVTKEALAEETDTKKQHKTLVIKDVRLFFNTVDRAVDTMREAGIPVESSRTEEDGEITLQITLPRLTKHTEESSA